MPSVHEHVQLFVLLEEQGRRIHLDEARRTCSFPVEDQGDTRAGRRKTTPSYQLTFKACEHRAAERKCDDDARTRRATSSATILGARVRDGR